MDKEVFFVNNAMNLSDRKVDQSLQIYWQDTSRNKASSN